MAKKQGIEWFGADTEQVREKKVASMLDGFKGVDSDVPKTKERTDPQTGETRLVREMVRMPAPRRDKLHVVTSGGKNISEELVRLKNRYKLMRSAFQFSNLDDKEMWEERMNIAFHEMQAQAFREKLANYKERNDNPRPEQVEHLQQLIDQHHGAWLRLIGQEK
jgi:hypothetical protein